VAAVAAPAAQDPLKWCDVSFTEAEAPQLALPASVPAREGASMPTQAADRWVWLNLWATWCGPCREEMPLITRWEVQLQSEGANVDLWFLSVDEDADALKGLLSEKPDFAPGDSLRIQNFSDLEGWMKGYKLDASASIPIQVLAQPGGKVRCVKMGALRDADYHALKSVVKGS
jgi:thiol-disulfide isomerase/thioredoxin